jgi:hypothetical protein
MNFFSKNRLVSLLLLFLVIINLTTIITFIVFYRESRKQAAESSDLRSMRSFREQLSLNPVQSERVMSINTRFRNISGPIASSIREKRSELLEELSKEKPDTILLKKLAAEIGDLHKDLQMASIRQYMNLKEVCDSCQCMKLSEFYFQLYGTPGPVKGMGRQMQHRYRNGMNKNGCEQMMNNGNPRK